MEKFAVIGNPVEHSLSPVIHQAFASQFNFKLEYEKLFADFGQFVKVAGHFRMSGGIGLNITVPFKQDAFSWVEQLSERATTAQAVNTISFRDNQVFGDNTDGAGLVRDLENNIGYPLAGKSILLLGAGGAVRGVLGPILVKKPERVLIANRTVKKARQLACSFSGSGCISGCGLEEIPLQGYDLVINATAASLGNSLPAISESLLDKTGLAYDMMYASRPTIFMGWANSLNVPRVSDGLGMLVEQAAESFYLWHGNLPDTEPVFRILQKYLDVKRIQDR